MNRQEAPHKVAEVLLAGRAPEGTVPGRKALAEAATAEIFRAVVVAKEAPRAGEVLRVVVGAHSRHSHRAT